MAVLKTRIEGFTIMEAVMGLLLIVIGFGITSAIILNVNQSMRSGAEDTAANWISQVWMECQKENEISSWERTQGELTCVKRVEPSVWADDVLEVSFTVYAGGEQIVWEEKHLMTMNKTTP